eukprot:g2873.t1
MQVCAEAAPAAPSRESDADGGGSSERAVAMAANADEDDGQYSSDSDDSREYSEGDIDRIVAPDSDEEESDAAWLAALNRTAEGGQSGGGGPASAGAQADERQRRVDVMLSSLLKLPVPVFTRGMLEYVLEDSVLEVLLAVITHPNDGAGGGAADTSPRTANGVSASALAAYERAGGGARPGGVRAADVDERRLPTGLVRAFRTASMLAAPDGGDALDALLEQRAAAMFTHLWRVFAPGARGCYGHACLVLGRIVEARTEEVYRLVGARDATGESAVGRFLGPILACVCDAQARELLCTLVCPPLASANQVCWVRARFVCSKETKWQYARALSEYEILPRLFRLVCAPDIPDARALAVAELLAELLRRLCVHEHGELLLAPLGHCPGVLNGPLDVVFSKWPTGRDGEEAGDGAPGDVAAAAPPPPPSAERRTACAELVMQVLRTCLEDEVRGPAKGPYQTFGGTEKNMVPNQLFKLSSDIVGVLRPHFGALSGLLVAEARHLAKLRQIATAATGSAEGGDDSVSHGAYVVVAPFTYFRLCVVSIVTALVADDANELPKDAPPEVWRALVTWFFDTPHSNMYHCLFYELLRAVLRGNEKAVLEALLQKTGLVKLLPEAFAAAVDPSVDPSGAGTRRRGSNIGHVLRCSNAIRLQASTLPPSSFLRIFLRSHDTWQRFVPRLVERTRADALPGLGIDLSEVRGTLSPASRDDLASGSFDTADPSEATSLAMVDVDIGLGFEDEVQWPDDESPPPGRKGAKKRGGSAGADKKSKKGGKSHKGSDRQVQSRASRERGISRGMADDMADALRGPAAAQMDSPHSMGRADDDFNGAASPPESESASIGAGTGKDDNSG